VILLFTGVLITPAHIQIRSSACVYWRIRSENLVGLITNHGAHGEYIGGRNRMRMRRVAVMLLAWMTLSHSSFIVAPLAAGFVCLAEVGGPVLKWQRGGCYSSWCETG